MQVYSSAKPRIVTCKRTTIFVPKCSLYAHFLKLLNVLSVLFPGRELLSKEYFIWNSTGTAPVSSGQMML